MCEKGIKEWGRGRRRNRVWGRNKRRMGVLCEKEKERGGERLCMPVHTNSFSKAVIFFSFRSNFFSAQKAN
jgi:hypothetical protein